MVQLCHSKAIAIKSRGAKVVRITIRNNLN